MRLSAKVLNLLHISRFSVSEAELEKSPEDLGHENPSYVSVDPDSEDNFVPGLVKLQNGIDDKEKRHYEETKAKLKPELYRRLIEEAPFVPSISNNSITNASYENPSFNTEDMSKHRLDAPTINKDNGEKCISLNWVDPELIREGKKFIRRNFFALFLAHLIALAFLLCVKPIQALLLRTGAIHKKDKTLKRYLSTILHVKRWYDSDLLTPDSKGARDIMHVKGLCDKSANNFKVYIPPPAEDLRLTQEEDELLHALSKDMDSSLTDIETGLDKTKSLDKIYTTVNPDVPLSQYDLAIVQFTFFGFVSLFPKVFGVHENLQKSKGFEGFVHLWAVLGHLLGLDERFNLCLRENFDEKTNELIFRDIFLFSFKRLDATAVRLWKTMTSGSCRYFFCLRTKAMLLFMSRNVAGVKRCRFTYNLMGRMEKLSYCTYSFMLNWMLRLGFVRMFLNLCSRCALSICNRMFLKGHKKECYDWDFHKYLQTPEYLPPEVIVQKPQPSKS